MDTKEERDGQLTFLDPVIYDRHPIDGALPTFKSLKDDWYTPPRIIEAARRVMGGIDLDPATTSAVNSCVVRATVFYTKETDGLAVANPWGGRVWLNPPYGKGKGSAKAFVRRLREEIALGNIEQAVTCLSANSMTASWAHEFVWSIMDVHCITDGRPNFYTEEEVKSAPTSGSLISYYGTHVSAFVNEFVTFGVCVRRC